MIYDLKAFILSSCKPKSYGEAVEVTREDFLNSSGIIAGSPAYFGVMAAELKKVFDEFVGIRI